MAVAERYNSNFVPKAPAEKSPFTSLDPRDFNEDGSLVDPAMATQGGKYWTNVALNRGWDPKNPPSSTGFQTIGEQEGGGSPGTGPAGNGIGISGMDMGLAGIGLGAISGMTPGIAGSIGSGIASAVSSMGNNTGSFTASTENGPIGVTGFNVPDNAITAAMGQLGLGLGPMGFEATPTPATPDEDMSVSGNISSAAGYTDPANITMGAMGELSQTAPNTADGSVSAGGGVGSAGPGDGTGAGAAAAGSGEAPHTGGYIAGPVPPPQQGGFGTVGVPPVIQALMQLKQMMNGMAPGGKGRRNDDPQGDGTGIAAGSGLPGSGGVMGGGEAAFGGGGEAFASVESAPSGDAASDSGAPSGDAGAPSGDSGAGAGDAGGVGNDGSSGDAGGAGGAFHSGGYVGDQDPMGGDVLARLQPGEFVVPRGPMAEMLREQNPALTKYGSLLTKSPIQNVVNPRDVAFGIPWGAIGWGINEAIGAGKALNKKYGTPQQPNAGAQTSEPYQPSPQDAPENGGFPDPGQPNVPMPQNNNTPPSERQEPEPPALRNEQGMQKLKKLMLEFS